MVGSGLKLSSIQRRKFYHYLSTHYLSLEYLSIWNTHKTLEKLKKSWKKHVLKLAQSHLLLLFIYLVWDDSHIHLPYGIKSFYPWVIITWFKEYNLQNCQPRLHSVPHQKKTTRRGEEKWLFPGSPYLPNFLPTTDCFGSLDRVL